MPPIRLYVLRLVANGPYLFFLYDDVSRSFSDLADIEQTGRNDALDIFSVDNERERESGSERERDGHVVFYNRNRFKRILLYFKFKTILRLCCDADSARNDCV